MKLRKILLSLALVSSLLVGCGSTDKQEDTNQSTNEQQEEKQEEDTKISVASVAISQVLSAMHQDIVGRPTTKLTLPEEYVSVPEIGNSFSPDFEKVLAVGTELLIADENFKDKIEKTAQEYNIDTFYVNTATYSSFIESIEKLGEKINKQQEATDIIQKINEPLKKYEGKHIDKKVAIIFGTSESNMLATDESYVGSLVKALGANNIVNQIVEKDKNALQNESNSYINLNIEQILENQPDIILRFGHGNVEEAEKSFQKLFDENPVWKNLDAVKNNQIYDLDAQIFNVSANMRIGEALGILGDILYEK